MNWFGIEFTTVLTTLKLARAKQQQLKNENEETKAKKKNKHCECIQWEYNARPILRAFHLLWNEQTNNDSKNRRKRRRSNSSSSSTARRDKLYKLVANRHLRLIINSMSNFICISWSYGYQNDVHASMNVICTLTVMYLCKIGDCWIVDICDERWLMAKTFLKIPFEMILN